jgi:phage tail P2-like protein
MYKIDDIGSLYRSLPPNLRTVENECMAYAVDRQIKKLTAYAEKLNLWGNLDEADPKFYGSMATCLQTPYYDSSYSDEIKLNLIKTTMETKKLAGTKKAVRTVLESIYGPTSETVPWYTYGGKPYHFKLRVKDWKDEKSIEKLSKIIEKAKAQRSTYEGVEMLREESGTIYSGTVTFCHYKPAAIIDGYRTKESADASYDAAVGALNILRSKAPAIVEA